MRPVEEYNGTDNRAVYNKVRKRILDKGGLIHCSRCPYHGSENDTNKYYVLYEDDKIKACQYNWRTRRPNWKLVSKNRKQWMDKGLKYEKNKSFGRAERNDYSITW